MKKCLCALAVALALLAGGTAWGEGYRISDANGKSFGKLLIRLAQSFETPSDGDGAAIEATLAAIGAVSEGDCAVARSIADHWSRVCVNADGAYPFYVWGGGELAVELADSDIPGGASHAFVVLGYELKNGEMRDELKGRCQAAAAAARSYPDAIIVCSGGATGDNNSEGHTEAGLMKQYLTEQCGIDAGRIYTDERAMTTAENALNTLEILRERGVETMTIVTSTYHQKRGQVLYNAVAALYEQTYGYRPQIAGNYSYKIASSYKKTPEDRLAVRQLASILGLPEDVTDGIRAALP